MRNVANYCTLVIYHPTTLENASRETDFKLYRFMDGTGKTKRFLTLIPLSPKFNESFYTEILNNPTNSMLHSFPVTHFEIIPCQPYLTNFQHNPTMSFSEQFGREYESDHGYQQTPDYIFWPVDLNSRTNSI